MEEEEGEDHSTTAPQQPCTQAPDKGTCLVPAPQQHNSSTTAAQQQHHTAAVAQYPSERPHHSHHSHHVHAAPLQRAARLLHQGAAQVEHGDRGVGGRQEAEPGRHEEALRHLHRPRHLSPLQQVDTLCTGNDYL